TILKTLQKNDAVIVGINAGLVGFLAVIDLEELDDKLTRIKAGDYTIEERIRLKVCLNDKWLLDCTNEGVIHSSKVSKMRDFEIKVDGEQAMCIRADGIIVSTSTGSTCYSLSVGGPIIDPKAEAFVIAPIAPFRLSARPIVVPAKSRIEIRPLKDKDCVLVLDGQEQMVVGPDDYVSFTMSEKRSKFVQFGKSFYDKVWENLAL
ncbi:MAG: NAD(+)/NADH kinase, partial [Thermoplasmata archaeon]|nr:NAD(+)/NADH kinase [Thermoplasmata archaeon]